MTRVLHTGDTHLGYQQYHVPERREDFLAAFRQVVEDAIADDVDAVVHAGDLFHDRRPTLPDLLGTIDVLERLDGAGIPFLAIVGNHEAKRDAQWLDLFESLGLATRLGPEPVAVGDVALYGLDFVPRAKREDFEPEFASHDADHAALVAHGLFEPFDLGEWDPREILDPADVDFDAMLLGDNHDADTAEVAETWVTYCGSTERASADEHEPRGYNLVTFEEGVDVARRGLDTREFVFVELELSAEEGIERIHDRVAEHDLEDAVVVVHVDGEGDPIPPASVEEFARERGALVARVTDHRERAESESVEVSFADPDDAVRERVRDLGLSEAARDLDETIRASKVPDSRVADTVESRVRDLLDEGASFESAPEEGASPDGGPDGNGDDDSAATDAPAAEGSDAPEPAAVEPSEGGAEGADDGGQESGVEADSGDPVADDDGTGDRSVSSDDAATATGGDQEEEDQATMEEYL